MFCMVYKDSDQSLTHWIYSSFFVHIFALHMATVTSFVSFFICLTSVKNEKNVFVLQESSHSLFTLFKALNPFVPKLSSAVFKSIVMDGF